MTLKGEFSILGVTPSVRAGFLVVQNLNSYNFAFQIIQDILETMLLCKCQEGVSVGLGRYGLCSKLCLLFF